MLNIDKMHNKRRASQPQKLTYTHNTSVYGKPKKSKLAVKLENREWEKSIPNPIGEIFSAVDPASLSEDNHPVVLLARSLAGRRHVLAGNDGLTREQREVLERHAVALANDFVSDIPNADLPGSRLGETYMCTY